MNNLKISYRAGHIVTTFCCIVCETFLVVVVVGIRFEELLQNFASLWELVKIVKGWRLRGRGCWRALMINQIYQIAHRCLTSFIAHHVIVVHTLRGGRDTLWKTGRTFGKAAAGLASHLLLLLLITKSTWGALIFCYRQLANHLGYLQHILIAGSICRCCRQGCWFVHPVCINIIEHYNFTIPQTLSIRLPHVRWRTGTCQTLEANNHSVSHIL